jgi:hypothetical protein
MSNASDTSVDEITKKTQSFKNASQETVDVAALFPI